METKTIVIVILAALVAVGLSVFQYLYKKDKSQLNYWLSLFRFLSLFSLFILIINPLFNKKTTELIKPNLVIAVDNSSSIKFAEQGDKVTALVKKIANNTALNKKFDISFYAFGKTIKTLDSLNFLEGETNLYAPIGEFSQLFSPNTSPIILISDGNQTSGKSITLAKPNNSVYTVVVGDTLKVEDLFISKLNSNKSTFVNNKFPVEVFINYQGEKNITKTFSIFNNNKKVFSKQFNFSPSNNVASFVFYLTAQNTGKQYYKAVIENIKNENNTINNSYNFNIDVIDNKSQILLVTAIKHPDLGALKKSIEASGQCSLTIVESTNLPLAISNYNLVILYQPNSSFTGIFEKLKTEEINYFIVTGLATDWDFLNKVQSNFNKKHTNLNENYGAVLNKNFSKFLTNDLGFANFPPLNDLFGELTFSKTASPILFQKIASVETEIPLMVSFEAAFQKTGLLLGENIWKWRMQVFLDTGSFELFDNFMAQWVQYLSFDLTQNRLNLNAKDIYYSNESIVISANYLDSNLQFDPRAKIWVNVKNTETGNEFKIPFSILGNKYQAAIPNLPPGKYSLEAYLSDGSQRFFGNFIVLPFELEQQFSKANYKVLSNLAAISGGKTYLLKDANELINYLELNNNFKTLQKVNNQKTPLIDWKWLLGLIILFLSVEWFTRKYFGKI